MKNPVIILVMLYLSTLSAHSQSGWLQINTGITNKNFHSVYFADAITGFVFGDTILKTTNGGFNWTGISAIQGFAYSAFFFNANTGIVGYSTIVAKTTNGASTWSIYNIPSITPPVYKFSFINQLTGWLASGLQFTGEIFKTTNGGINWFSQLSDAGQMYVKFINANTGFKRGFYDGLSKSVDGGNSWYRINPDSLIITSCFAVDTSTVYGRNNLTRLVKTINGGVTWIDLNCVTFSSCYFLNASTGFLYGSNDSISITTDGGYSWSLQYTSSQNGIISDMYFVNSLIGWAVGNTGTILSTTTGGNPIGIENESNQIPSGYKLLGNYPNPFNPSTTIEFDVPFAGNYSDLKLSVYDVLGNVIDVLASGKFTAGRHSISWKANDRPSGVYFVRLVAEGFTESKRMILLK